MLALVALVVQAGCASWEPRVSARAESSTSTGKAPGEARFHLELSSHGKAVRITPAQFDSALSALVLQVPLRVAAPLPSREPLVVRASFTDDVRGTHLSRAYGDFCEQRGTPGDCLQLYRDGPGLDGKDKRDIALALSVSAALESRDEAVRSMFSTAQLWTTLSLTLTGYMALLVAPEPVSKGVAAALTVLLWAYLGMEFFTLIQGYLSLSEEAAEASTFSELRAAGERFGKVIGPNSVHILLILGTAAVGETASLVSRAEQLPGFSQAALRASTQGLRLREAALAADQVQVAVSEGTVGVVLPANALSMAVRDSLSRAGSGKRQVHHIATVENNTSTARGGPWTPKFKRIFDKAGMSMEDAANKVELDDHQGPHPEAYHEAIMNRLNKATEACQSTVQCRTALIGELQQLAQELSDPTSTIYILLTGGTSF